MTWTPDHIRLWPRLIGAARQIHPGLVEYLDNLRATGALLRQAGPALSLQRGTASEIDFARVRQHTRIAEVIATAKHAPHPWRETLSKAYAAVHARSNSGSAALEEVVSANDRETAERYARILANIHRHGLMLLTASTMASGEIDEAAKRNAGLIGEHEDDLRRLRSDIARAGIAYDEAPQSYPLHTADVVVWVVEQAGARPKAATDDDLILTAGELGEALAPLSWEANWEEAG